MEINLLGHLYDDTVYHEIGAVDELAGGLGGVVGGTVFGPHPVVDGCLGLFDMQLARIAVSVFAAEVIDVPQSPSKERGFSAAPFSSLLLEGSGEANLS